jgi:hypothetical protein
MKASELHRKMDHRLTKKARTGGIVGLQHSLAGVGAPGYDLASSSLCLVSEQFTLRR